MQKIRVPVNSFRFGEVSPSTLMRSDTDLYTASAQRIENMLVTTEGSAKKRPDLKHLHKYADINNQALGGQSHLFHFVFDENEKYVISIEHQKINCFYMDDTGVYGAAGELVLVETITQDTNADPLPFDRDYIQQYTYSQSGDVMFICHPLFMPRMLIRTALDAFEVTPYTFDMRADGLKTYQPYSRFQGQNVTLDPSATTGTGVTLTVSENYFTADHVGVTLKYGDAEIVITSVTSPTVAVGDILDELKVRLQTLNPLRTIDGSSTVEVTHIGHGFGGGETIFIEDAAATGGINAGNLNGNRVVSSIIDENTYTFTAGGAASSAEDGGGYVSIVCHAPTDDWTEQSFSAARGYPAAVTFHENRIVFAGTIAQPDTLWFSKIGQFFNFDFGIGNDDEAFDLTASTGDVNSVRYLVSNRDLQVFTDSAELYVPTYLNQAITPTNAQIKKQTPYGCEFTYPHPFDGATLFIQAGGNVMREYLYTDTESAYTSTSVSGAASHLVVDPKCMAVVNGAFDQAESYAALSLGNGEVSLFNSNRAERRAAWTRVTTAGNFCSLLGVGTRLFANVWGSDGFLHLMEMTGTTGMDFTKSLTAVSNLVDVSHAFVEGDVVNVFGNGVDYLGPFTVDANQKIDVTVYSAYSTFTVGKAFTVNITSNPITIQGSNGTTAGAVRGISAVVLDLIETENVQVNGRPSMITASFTGKREVRTNAYGRDPQVTITQNQPSPLQVNGFIAELVI